MVLEEFEWKKFWWPSKFLNPNFFFLLFFFGVGDGHWRTMVKGFATGVDVPGTDS